MNINPRVPSIVPTSRDSLGMTYLFLDMALAARKRATSLTGGLGPFRRLRELRHQVKKSLCFLQYGLRIKLEVFVRFCKVELFFEFSIADPVGFSRLPSYWNIFNCFRNEY